MKSAVFYIKKLYLKRLFMTVLRNFLSQDLLRNYKLYASKFLVVCSQTDFVMLLELRTSKILLKVNAGLGRKCSESPVKIHFTSDKIIQIVVILKPFEKWSRYAFPFLVSQRHVIYKHFHNENSCCVLPNKMCEALLDAHRKCS